MQTFAFLYFPRFQEKVIILELFLCHCLLNVWSCTEELSGESYFTPLVDKRSQAKYELVLFIIKFLLLLWSGLFLNLALLLLYWNSIPTTGRWLIRERLKSSVCWERDSFQPISVVILLSGDIIPNSHSQEIRSQDLSHLLTLLQKNASFCRNWGKRFSGQIIISEMDHITYLKVLV